MGKNTGKVREICQAENVGTMLCCDSTESCTRDFSHLVQRHSHQIRSSDVGDEGLTRAIDNFINWGV